MVAARCVTSFVAWTAIVCLLSSVSIQAGAAPSTKLDLSLVPAGVANEFGAKCLDGSVPGIYIKRNASSTKWVIFFKGGGWCFNEADCLARSVTTLGSSKPLPGSFNFDYGVTAGSASHNPNFVTFNRVVLWYCDGGSWSGNRQQPVAVNGTNLWFRGRGNLDAQFQHLHNKFDFGSATEVLLGGGSAGALASYFHAEHIASEWIPSSVTRLKLLPASGFFLNATSVQGDFVYGDSIRYMGHMMNSSAGLNQRCVHESGDWTVCLTAQGTLPYITSMPLFVLNSIHDYWQVMCILTATFTDQDTSETCSNAPGWHNCAKAGNNGLSVCSADQINVFNAYGSAFMQDLKSTLVARPGNGAFLSSCVTHVAVYSSLFTRLQIAGVSMAEAVWNWWNAPATAPFSDHSHTACSLNPNTPSHQCNPTCKQ